MKQNQIWECVSDIDKKEQGPVICVSLPDKVRSACRDFAVADLNKDDGLSMSINELVTLYVKVKNISLYCLRVIQDISTSIRYEYNRLFKLSLKDYTMILKDLKWVYHQLY